VVDELRRILVERALLGEPLGGELLGLCNREPPGLAGSERPLKAAAVTEQCARYGPGGGATMLLSLASAAWNRCTAAPRACSAVASCPAAALNSA